MYLTELERTLYKKLFFKKSFQEKLKFTKQCIEEMLKVCPSAYVSFSFGKDSIVMSHIVRQIVPDIPHIFTYHPETYLLISIEDVDIAGINLKKIQLSKESFNKDGEVIDVHNRQASQEFFNEIKKYEGVFKGIRAEEAKYREYAVNKRKKDFLIHKYDLEKKGENWYRKYSCFPIGLWKDEDIKIYLSYYDLAIPRQYEEKNRTAAGFTSSNYDSDLVLKLKKDLLGGKDY